ncbi:MAG: hypothetical protein JO316_16725 [Abitibacteriaceae bacterium]|nr:hypothetical protein [Abditibacteriaceae bacterium]MBV9866999.1 hypothetical protein [Abditibacteriaceae bacterium]
MDTLFILLAIFLIWLLLGIVAAVLLNHREDRAAQAREIAHHSVTVEVD